MHKIYEKTVAVLCKTATAVCRQICLNNVNTPSDALLQRATSPYTGEVALRSNGGRVDGFI